LSLGVARRLVRPRRDRGSGQALVELALVVPILVLLMMAIFQFAFVIQTQMGLSNAVREAARRAAAADSLTTDWVRTQLCGSDTSSCDSGLLAANVQGFDDARLIPSNTVSIGLCTYDVSGIPNYRIDISVRYGNTVFFPMLAYATDEMDGTRDGLWEIGQSAQMRLEHDLSSPPGSC
jgi:Flp pilus assembly protein TadG